MTARVLTTDEPLTATAIAPRRVRIGALWIDAVTFAGALDRIAALVEAGRGGVVFTPNVDHVVTAEDDHRLRAAYSRADLSLADGAPIPWAARLLGTPVPEKVSGSDIVGPLASLAARRSWRVFLLGASPATGARAAARLGALGVTVVGRLSPAVDGSGRGADDEAVVAAIRAARPHLLLVALGSPKQELWIDAHRASLGPVVAAGLGASLDFLAGSARRAPRWVSRVGLEWVYRLAREPRRLWRRYLVRDPRFVAVIVRTALLPRATRSTVTA